MIKVFFINRKILFVVFTCIPAFWILLSPVVNLISFDVDEYCSANTGIMHSPVQSPSALQCQELI